MPLPRPLVVTRLLVVAILALAIGADTPQARQTRRTAWLDTAVRQARATDTLPVWVYFTDKGQASAGAETPVATAHALVRRARRGSSTARAAAQDRPLADAYVATVAGLASRVRQQSRWLNAMSVEATPAQIAAIERLSFVSQVDVVRRYRRLREEPVVPLDDDGRGVRSGARDLADEPLDYGTGIDQVRQIRVPELHQRGLHGEGVIVAVFDSGFPNLAHEAFAGMTILAERDFVDGRDSVRESTDAHGTNTLSTLGGYAPGQLVGPAFGASFILAVTEDVRSETPVEEDNWAAAAEWAEALGADVISSWRHRHHDPRGGDGRRARRRGGQLGRQRRLRSVRQHPWRASRRRAGGVGGRRDPQRHPRRVQFGGADRGWPDQARRRRHGREREHAYGIASGTSFSCPLTAGVVALVLQAHPDYTPDDVLMVLRGSASQAAAPDTLLGWGIVDAVAAVDWGLGTGGWGLAHAESRSLEMRHSPPSQGVLFSFLTSPSPQPPSPSP